VGLEGRVGLFFDGGGQALVADVDHRVEVVGVGAVHLALGGRLALRSTVVSWIAGILVLSLHDESQHKEQEGQ